MSPMSSSVAPALADGSGDYDSSDERRRGITIDALQPHSMEVDDDDDDDGDSKDDEEEERRILASAMRRDYINGEGDASDSESSSVGGAVPTNLQDHLLGLIRQLDEMNALDAARDAERAARVAAAGGGGGSTPSAPSTSRRRRPDAVRSRSSAVAADYGARPGGESGSSSSTGDDEPEGAAAAAWGAHTSMLGLGYEYADPRVIPVSPSTYLRPGSRFHGTQQSERQRYDVQVEIKHVDLRESFLCGYLRIQGKAILPIS